jgi:hypothetical protein
LTAWKDFVGCIKIFSWDGSFFEKVIRMGRADARVSISVQVSMGVPSRFFFSTAARLWAGWFDYTSVWLFFRPGFGVWR